MECIDGDWHEIGYFSHYSFYINIDASGRRFAIRFLFLDLFCFMVENVLSHTYVLLNIKCICSVKSFNLGNLSLLTNFQNLT